MRLWRVVVTARTERLARALTALRKAGYGVSDPVPIRVGPLTPGHFDRVMRRLEGTALRVNDVTLRIIFAGLFALISLAGALALEAMDRPAAQWLVALTAASAGYIFGHVQSNGFTGKKPNGDGGTG